MYVQKNFKTKKALIEAIKAGEKHTVYQPGPFGDGKDPKGVRVFIEGPHYPEAHKWYAEAWLDDQGYIIKVR